MMSSPPSFSAPAPTKLSAKPGLVTSPLTATASPPSALISSTPAQSNERRARDAGKALVEDDGTDLRRREGVAHDVASGLRTTMTRVASATCSPRWLTILVVTSIRVIAPPFFWVTPVTVDLQRQFVADDDGREIGESLLAVQHPAKIDVQRLEHLERVLRVHHLEAEEIGRRDWRRRHPRQFRGGGIAVDRIGLAERAEEIAQSAGLDARMGGRKLTPDRGRIDHGCP